MKRILTIILGVALLAACSEKEPVNKISDSGFRLNLTTSSTATKAAVAGEDAYNENKIASIHYFIYTADATAASAPVKDGVATVNATGSKTIELPFLDTDFTDVIFPDDAETAKIFVLANCDETAISAITTKSVTNLKAMAVAFADANKIQDSFVMWGEGTATDTSSGSSFSADADVSLKRVATKISLKIDVARTAIEEDDDTVVDPGTGESATDEDPDDVWTPVISDMVVKFYGGVNNGVIDGTPVTGATINTCTRSAATNNGYTFTASTTDASDPYHGTDFPFYSYPRTWTTASSTEPYFLITLGWEKGSDSSFAARTCYYKVVLNNSAFNSNDWYNITVIINEMASEGETVEVCPMTCEVAGWEESIVTEHETGADSEYNTVVDIAGTRFLTGPKEIVLYNQELSEIVFKSSHPLTVKNITYDSGNDAATANSRIEALTVVGGNPINRVVLFNHAIENDQTRTKYDYKDYKVTFRVQHNTSDSALDAQYYIDVTVIQKPALCITSEICHNYASSVFVDGNPRTFNGTSGLDYYCRVGWGTEGNQPMVNVEVTVLPDDSEYIIGDPRIRTNVMETSPWLSSANGSAERGKLINKKAPHMDGTANHRLTYYYPASDENKHVIAPSFRMSTKYSSINGTLTHDEAKMRCATFQEAGYPAGRWRLPTEAEFRYVINLQVKGYIADPIFTDNHTYWCASTGFEYRSNQITETTSTSLSVRCVYDSWYWDNSQYPRIPSTSTNRTEWNTFTWGDDQVF